MASVYMRTTKKGVPFWQVLIRRVGEEQIIARYPTEALARAFAEEAEAKILTERKEKFDPRASLPDSGLWADETLFKSISLYCKTEKYTKQQATILPTVCKHIGRVTISKLSELWIENYVSDMRGQKTSRGTTFACTTILKHLVMIKIVLKWRARQLGEAVPPFHIRTGNIFPQGWDVMRDRRLDEWEEGRLFERFETMEGAPKRFWPLLIRLALETGARQQELVKATWSEFSPKFWTIPAKHTKCKKTRVVPLTQAARDAVTELCALKSKESPRLFHTWSGAPVVSALFSRIAKEVGLVDFRFHDLRHEGISRLVLKQRNFSIYEIMRIVGHSTPEMIDRYANLRGDELADKLI